MFDVFTEARFLYARAIMQDARASKAKGRADAVAFYVRQARREVRDARQGRRPWSAVHGG